MVEPVVRAHVAVKGSGEDLRRIQNDEYTVNFKQIGPKIDADFGLGHLMENFLNDVTRNALHSYTHSGMLQLGRPFDGNDIKPNYKDPEIIEVVRVTTTAVFMVTNLVTKQFAFEEDWKRVTEWFAEWGAFVTRNRTAGRSNTPSLALRSPVGMRSLVERARRRLKPRSLVWQLTRHEWTSCPSRSPGFLGRDVRADPQPGPGRCLPSAKAGTSSLSLAVLHWQEERIPMGSR